MFLVDDFWQVTPLCMNNTTISFYPTTPFYRPLPCNYINYAILRFNLSNLLGRCSIDRVMSELETRERPIKSLVKYISRPRPGHSDLS